MKKRAVFLLNFAVLLFGLAGLFAKWVQLPAIAISFGRVFFSSITLGLFMVFKGQRIRVQNKKDGLMLVSAGAILALHWWSFLKAIQLSTVAVGTITFSSFPLFVTFLEPILFHRKPVRKNIMIAVVILVGVIITVPEFSFDNSVSAGIMTGMLSAFSYAMLTIMNKGFSGKYTGTLIAFYEQAAAAIVLLPFVLSSHIQPSETDIGLLLLLGIGATAIAHTLFISSLKEIPAQLAGICSSMETVYGILFAFLLLGETPSLREILGAVVIIGAVTVSQLSENV